MIALSVWTLIGVSKRAGNGDAVEVVVRSGPCSVLVSLFGLVLTLLLILMLRILQVRDEYRTDYDPDILLLTILKSLFICLVSQDFSLSEKELWFVIYEEHFPCEYGFVALRSSYSTVYQIKHCPFLKGKGKRVGKTESLVSFGNLFVCQIGFCPNNYNGLAVFFFCRNLKLIWFVINLEF